MKALYVSGLTQNADFFQFLRSENSLSTYGP